MLQSTLDDDCSCCVAHSILCRKTSSVQDKVFVHCDRLGVLVTVGCEDIAAVFLNDGDDGIVATFPNRDEEGIPAVAEEDIVAVFANISDIAPAFANISEDDDIFTAVGVLSEIKEYGFKEKRSILSNTKLSKYNSTTEASVTQYLSTSDSKIFKFKIQLLRVDKYSIA